MKIWKNVLCTGALVGATMVVTTTVVSQQQEDKMAEMQEMYESWMKLAQPGPEHAKLMQATGNWHQENTHWMYPGAEPTKSTSMVEMRPILGGRFMMERTRGTMDFQGESHEFEGLGIFGYDNFKKKHTFVWVDNMGTMMMFGEGTADPSGDVVTYFSEMPNPMTGGTVKIKSVSRRVNDDTHAFEMYERLPDNTWHKNMEMVAKRMQ